MTIAAETKNLMEVQTAVKPRRASANGEWLNQVRFGMFVHYGLYSLVGRGEWAMFDEKIPAEKYNVLAEQFDAKKFDADKLVSLAKRAGAGYVVLGARHHEGFCLWDTKTTDFNTVKTAAGRDLIREYVKACRRAKLRVGIYYSIMSWQWPAIFHGPAKDPEGWEGMVNETHEQLRELMTDYGQIDMLWYDGCVVPGLGDASLRVKYWRSRELNAMVRKLQPKILINDRAALPEDITTPEQHLNPAPRGRLWEFCQTIGVRWGWLKEPGPFKEPGELIRNLVMCARFGGAYLLNVGPHPEGWVIKEDASRMEAIGRWLKINGESIRGSERTAYTEAQHLIGSATCRGKRLYFHLTEWPDGPARIAGVKVPIVSVKLLKNRKKLKFEQNADGTATIFGLPTSERIDDDVVIAVELAKAPSRTAPPALLIERETGVHDAPEASLRAVAQSMATSQTLVFDAPTTGVYRLDFQAVSEKTTALSAALDGQPLARKLRMECGNYPTALQLEERVLTEGRHELVLSSKASAFALSLWRLQPIWKTITANQWRTIGPFPTDFGPQGSTAEVRAALKRAFPPEKEFDKKATYKGVEGLKVGWRTSPAPDESLNFAKLQGTQAVGVCYARMVVTSPQAKDCDILLGCDWWVNLYVNGKLVRSQRDPKAVKDDGAWFNGWKPISARVSLQKGKNVLLVKCHPGSIDNWFTFFVNDPGDLKFTL